MNKTLDSRQTIFALGSWPNRRHRLAARAWLRKLKDVHNGDRIISDTLRDLLRDAPELKPFTKEPMCKS